VRKSGREAARLTTRLHFIYGLQFALLLFLNLFTFFFFMIKIFFICGLRANLYSAACRMPRLLPHDDALNKLYKLSRNGRGVLNSCALFNYTQTPRALCGPSNNNMWPVHLINPPFGQEHFRLGAG